MRPGGSLVAEVPSPVWLEQLVVLPPTGDRVLRRSGPSTCTFEDRVADATIEARVLTAEEWNAALAPGWIIRVEPLGDLEWLVAGSRAR